ncbi:MAG: phosphoribosylformylglycinamidine cyclo-ligase [Deltaproteobacteria bacterium]|nr:phosphoribosylformylglycinamidine cyclo-ligase [Deltaproteobacteria bacterium]MBW1738457.1 phosphoribosylformylglycinamidine cyclo-ligase [Deltaproteobacteria bacterium]MBW2034116.1 phosphoribosylformylglycinamidine cyclo-ligase [Deltaproteobacteria bacterium]MBW2115717.1 phosphoribosylformylglycinamidine cyclo-ligase [Deltaproteobacteria bacterium]MBW2358902.1 phosphoribosylformylglycinamidine cyclo-ligase [Deltaproteobacteria bacterium]
MGKKTEKSKYAEAGVDIDAGNRLVELLKPIVSKTFKRGVISEIGGFAGLFSLSLENIRNPVLVSSTDGVGTKLRIAFMLDKHDTVGIDLVAMCVNDILVQGANPLFFLDYISMGKLEVNKAQEIVKGIAEGCQEAGCSLLGGETAEMPGFYAEGEYDLAGFVVGIAENEDLLDGSEIAVGHQLIGIASSGLHSNGYSLVRKIFFEGLKMSVDDYVEDFGRTLGEELLEPTRIYARAIGNLSRDFRICGISHITGGGLVDNLPRIIPKACKTVIRRSSWPVPPVFSFIQKAGQISDQEMMRTFNNGLGMVIVVNEEENNEVLSRLNAMGETAFYIGSVESRGDDEGAVQFAD